MKRFMTRDHIVWSFGFAAAVLLFVGTQATDLVAPAYVPKVLALSGLLGFIAGKLGNSPLPGRSDDGQKSDGRE